MMRGVIRLAAIVALVAGVAVSAEPASAQATTIETLAKR